MEAESLLPVGADARIGPQITAKKCPAWSFHLHAGLFSYISIVQQIQRILIRGLGGDLHGSLVLVLVQHSNALGGVSQRNETTDATGRRIKKCRK